MIQPLPGEFPIQAGIKVKTTGLHPDLVAMAQFLMETPEITHLIDIYHGDRTIHLEIDTNNQISDPEGYVLLIHPDEIKLTALQPAGLFHGIQTIRQLFQPQEHSIPAMNIVDSPRYPWRGLMLDVSRHFFSVADVKHLIDQMALFKLNRLHLHLSDDQGWRIEIHSWPDLTRIGSLTAVNGDTGGYYSQSDFKEIVSYAQSRYIQVIPEIDLPGHTNAALASYPKLNRGGVAPEMYTGIEVGFSSLDPDAGITYQFINDVIREIAAISPNPYIHIGGDEATATPPQKYAGFIKRVEQIVKSHSKHIIGWEEIGKTNPQPDSLIQTWKIKDKIKIPANNRVILSPASRTYLDMKYNEQTMSGLQWAGFVELRDSYEWDPVNESAHSQILGIEAAIWTETLNTPVDLEYMLFPRLTAIAETAWTPQTMRSWEDFRGRIAHMGKWLEFLGINFHHSTQVDWEE